MGVTFEFAPPKTLEINGVEYPVLMSEDEILDNIMAFTATNPTATVAEQVDRVHSVDAFCTKMIGRGALKKIIGKNVVSIERKAEIVFAIATAACEAYRKKLEEYE